MKKGVTLIELLLVIVIIAILVTLGIVALNPAGTIGDAQTSVQESLATEIAEAFQKFSLDDVGDGGSGLPDDDATASDITTGLYALTATGNSAPAAVDADVAAAVNTVYSATPAAYESVIDACVALVTSGEFNEVPAASDSYDEFDSDVCASPTGTEDTGYDLYYDATTETVLIINRATADYSPLKTRLFLGS